MDQKTKKDSHKENILSKINATWAAIIAGCTLFSLGFGAGYYISNVLNKIEVNEVNQEYNEKLYNQKKDFDSQCNELIHEKYLLEIENGKLRKK